MRLGVVILPEHRWSAAQGIWRRAEELGFDHAWTYDHLAWRSLRDSPWFGTVPTLAAAATVTTTMRLGTLVTSPNFRHPVVLAKDLMTMDDLSGGRLVVGIGAGATGYDATMLGQTEMTPGERAERFEEFVDLTDRLLRQPSTTFHGRYFTAVEARSVPGCVQEPRVPFAIAAAGQRGMRIAATYGQAWITIGDPNRSERLGPEEGARLVGRQVAMLERECARLGRDPSNIDRMVLTGTLLDPAMSSAGAFDEAVGIYEEVGVTDLVVHWPRPEEPYAANREVFERIFGR